jgi:hypothetical protein
VPGGREAATPLSRGLVRVPALHRDLAERIVHNPATGDLPTYHVPVGGVKAGPGVARQRARTGTARFLFRRRQRRPATVITP